MPFQFTCPQGHLLSADESQGGQQSQCPQCGSLFLIPYAPGYHPPAPQPDYSSAPQIPADLLDDLPGATPRSPAGPGYGQSLNNPDPRFGGEIRPGILHIPCPNGHLLETPPEMLDQLMMCPLCGAQFAPRYEASEEHRKQKEKIEEAQFARSGQIWIRWAIGIAVLVVVGLIAMIVIQSQRH